jgi:type VI protein secretion system component VasF
MQRELNRKMQRIHNQINQIQDKSEIALTRSRMLEIAQERNIYARKMYYSLIALILFIIVMALFIYMRRR